MVIEIQHIDFEHFVCFLYERVPEHGGYSGSRPARKVYRLRNGSSDLFLRVQRERNDKGVAERLTTASLDSYSHSRRPFRRVRKLMSARKSHRLSAITKLSL